MTQSWLPPSFRKMILTLSPRLTFMAEGEKEKLLPTTVNSLTAGVDGAWLEESGKLSVSALPAELVSGAEEESFFDIRA